MFIPDLAVLWNYFCMMIDGSGSGSGSRAGSGSGSTSKKVTVLTVPVPVPQHWDLEVKKTTDPGFCFCFWFSWVSGSVIRTFFMEAVIFCLQFLVLYPDCMKWMRIRNPGPTKCHGSGTLPNRDYCLGPACIPDATAWLLRRPRSLFLLVLACESMGNAALGTSQPGSLASLSTRQSY